MENIFTSKENARVRPHDLLIKSHNIATYKFKNLRTNNMECTAY